MVKYALRSQQDQCELGLVIKDQDSVAMSNKEEEKNQQSDNSKE